MKKNNLKFVSVLFIFQNIINLPIYAYIIREANDVDIIQLTDCHYNSWHSTYDDVLDNKYCLKNSLQRLKNYWSKFFSKKDSRFVLIAEQNNKIIGLISAGPFKNIKEENFITTSDIRSAEIYKLYIRQEDQKKGIGKSLLQSCSKRLILENYKELFVRVFSENKNACDFYKSQGFCFQQLFNYSPLIPYNIYSSSLH